MIRFIFFPPFFKHHNSLRPFFQCLKTVVLYILVQFLFFFFNFADCGKAKYYLFCHKQKSKTISLGENDSLIRCNHNLYDTKWV